jgi:hypothetical protein
MAAHHAAGIEKAQVLTPETRFGIHALKQRGVKDSADTRCDNQDAIGQHVTHDV